MSINAMTLQELRYLVAVADTRNFSEAAKACFVTQPTLSTQLKKLEDFLGVRLVERTNKSVHLTPVGEKVVQRARTALAECGAIEELARTFGDPFSEPFRTGIISTLGPYLLPRLLPVLERGLPRMKLIIHEGLTEDLLARLAAHELDCALLALPVTEPNLHGEALFDEPFWLVCRGDHPLAKKRLVAEAELAEHTVMLLSEGHCLRDQALALCGQRATPDLEPQDTYRATSLETLRHLVAAGFGCTLLPALALGDELAEGARVRAIALDSPKARRTIGLVWRRGYPRAETLEKFAAFVAKRGPGWTRLPRRKR